MGFGKECYDRLVMSAMGKGMESGEPAVYLLSQDAGMVFSSIINILGKRTTPKRRHSTSEHKMSHSNSQGNTKTAFLFKKALKADMT